MQILQQPVSIAQHLDLSTLTVEPDLDPTPPTAPARVRKPFDQGGRNERGYALALVAIICGYGRTYFCQSASDPNAAPYMVEFAADGPTCTCKDHEFAITRERAKGNAAARCLHVVAVETQIAATMPMAA